LGRPTVAEINLSSLRHNLGVIRGYLKSTTKILAVVKADAYGHGAVKVASTLVEEGVRHFGVATVEEGLELRSGGLAEDIIVLGGVFKDQLKEAVTAGLQTVVGSLTHLKELSEEAERLRIATQIHLKIDTGMGRLGVFPHEVEESLSIIDENPYLQLRGVMSHLSSADGTGKEDDSFTKEQLLKFEKIISGLRLAGVSIHVLNSAGIFNYSDHQYHMVRPGISLYGSLPQVDFGDLGLLPVMTLLTRIAYVKCFPEGSPISYGRNYYTKRKERIGILPIGYADGIRRFLYPGYRVVVEGSEVPIVGTICMDNVMIDITDLPDAGEGSEVMIFGERWGVRKRVEELASRGGTIPYEVLTGIGKRVPRLFVE